MENETNELTLRDKLAIQRTTLANQSTLLAYIRTSLYFLVAALSIRKLLGIKDGTMIEIFLFSMSFVIMVSGFYTFIFHKQKINKQQSELN